MQKMWQRKYISERFLDIGDDIFSPLLYTGNKEEIKIRMFGLFVSMERINKWLWMDLFLIWHLYFIGMRLSIVCLTSRQAGLKPQQ